jgi:DnaK suppressor protein
MPRKKDETRAQLEARLESLQGRLTEMNNTLREPEDDDLMEQAADLDDDYVLERLTRAGRTEAVRIESALKRIENGTYGKCVECGEDISERRLKALPEAERCMACAQKSSGR